MKIMYLKYASKFDVQSEKKNGMLLRNFDGMIFSGQINEYQHFCFKKVKYD